MLVAIGSYHVMAIGSLLQNRVMRGRFLWIEKLNSGTNLNKCPCGCVPENLVTSDIGDAMLVMGDCCHTWLLYVDSDEDAVEVWNHETKCINKSQGDQVTMQAMNAFIN